MVLQPSQARVCYGSKSLETSFCAVPLVADIEDPP
jgi:hypothetical protein